MKTQDTQPSEIKVWNPLNVHLRPRAKKLFTQKSLTVPDQSMSIRELLKRYASGQSLDGGREPIYDEGIESSGIDLRRLDLIDIQRLKLENKERLDLLKQKAEADDAAYKEKAKKAAEALKEAEKDAKLLEEAKANLKKQKTQESEH